MTFPTFPGDCMGVVIMEHPKYPDVRAYCTQKGCLVCLSRAHLGKPRACWKGSDCCYPEDALETLPRPVIDIIRRPTAPLRALDAGKPGHTSCAVSIIVTYNSRHSPDEVREIGDWKDILAAAWYRQTEV